MAKLMSIFPILLSFIDWETQRRHFNTQPNKSTPKLKKSRNKQLPTIDCQPIYAQTLLKPSLTHFNVKAVTLPITEMN